jgi:thioredoxin reductase (NADPH)
VHYWASPIEAKLCANQEVTLVGAGNSAGQAVVYLAGQGVKVSMLVRRQDLAETMSRYLVDRIRSLPNIEVVTGATVSGLEGRNSKSMQCPLRSSALETLRSNQSSTHLTVKFARAFGGSGELGTRTF